MGDSKKSYSSFYNGGMSSFEPNYGEGESWGTTTGYSGPAGTRLLGFPGSPQTANQLGEAVNAIKQGVTSFEVTMLTAGTQGAGQAEQIPKQHFEEMRALMKLTGVRPSLHGPIDLDPSGMGQQGFDEDDRQQNERRFFHALENARKLDTGKNIKVVFHSSAGLPGTEYKPGDISKNENRWIEKKIPIVDRETGQIINAAKEDRHFDMDSPQTFDLGGEIQTPQDQIRAVNSTLWRNKILEVQQYKKMTDEVLGYSSAFLADYNKMKAEGKKLNEIEEEMQKNGVRQYYDRMKDAERFNEQTRLKLNSTIETAYKYGNEDQKKEIKNMVNEYKKEISSAEKTILQPIAAKSAMDGVLQKLSDLTLHGIKDKKTGEVISAAPQVVMQLEDFSREKAAKTFGNLAWNAYEKLGGENAPVVAIENMFAGEWVHSTAEGMKKLIDASRDKFVENAKEKGMSESSAKKAAEKLIGATWDVGHLNMMKKHGFTDEDVIKATKDIAPYVKHVHLTDNFGYSDSHLAPGMGNVPIKAILEELEKKGDLASMNKIVESGGFVQHFKKSPHGITMAALGSPIYGAKMGPYWSQAMAIPFSGGYMGGPLAYLPEKHFSTYGSGFSSLPTEVGGQIPGTGSRFSGAGMA